MSLTVKDIKDKFDESYDSDHGFGISGFADELWNYQNKELDYNINGLPTIKFVDAGGGEGDGAEMWVVFSVAGQLFRMTGCYSSWGGDEWDGDLSEVKAVQVMRTEYEAK